MICISCTRTETRKWYEGPTCRACWDKNCKLNKYIKCTGCGKEGNAYIFRKGKCSPCRLTGPEGELIRKAKRDWVENNKEYVKEYKSKNRLKNIRPGESSKYWHRYKNKPEYRFKQSKSVAKREKREWSIEFEVYCSLIKSKCCYCKESIEEECGKGLDRIDNTKGYSLENVVSCCGDCNKTRGNRITHEEMKHVMKTLIFLRRGCEIKTFETFITKNSN